MKTLKSIDGKSLLIGGLLASTIFFAMGATSSTDKWDDKQEWEVATGIKLEKTGFLTYTDNTAKGPIGWKVKGGWEPFTANGQVYRRRIK